MKGLLWDGFLVIRPPGVKIGKAISNRIDKDKKLGLNTSVIYKGSPIKLAYKELGSKLNPNTAEIVAAVFDDMYPINFAVEFYSDEYNEVELQNAEDILKSFLIPCEILDYSDWELQYNEWKHNSLAELQGTMNWSEYEVRLRAYSICCSG